MNIIPSSRLAVATSSATRNDDAARGARECHSKVPVVKLDVDTISDMMASSLASSLLAHVLFLKNQIPLPVLQLAKLSNTKRNNNATDTRATKQRTELLATYDTLASHLNTTFTSLSTAFARCKRLDASSQASYQPTAPSEQDNSDEEGGASVSRRKTVRAYVAILVGPSIGSARSKVLLGVDGLEARIWGKREDVPRVDADEREVDDNEEDEVEESEDEESEEEDSEESEDNEESAEQEEGEEFDEQEPLELSDEEEYVFDGDEATPPPSSPSLSSNSSSSSPLSSPHISPKLSPTSISPLKSSPTHSQPSPTKATSPPYISHAQQQKTLLNAERLLSRTLALADADGYCLASDMTPTQTHILIRAPRRFSHPAWIPRQNVTASMEKVLEEFLEQSAIALRSTLPADRSCQNKGNGRKAGQKNTKKVEGVWVVGRGSRIGKDEVEDEGKEPDDEQYENDDIIWWSWDGKLVGFSDW
ncbi:hypothetical protein JOM56_012474 [Amanita muscaria]